AAPRPRPAPVTTATWPSKRMGPTAFMLARSCRQLAECRGHQLRLSEHRIVTALEVAAMPAGAARALDQAGIERRLQGGAQEGPRQLSGFARAEPHRLLEAAQRMRCQPLLDPWPQHGREALRDVSGRRHAPSIASR